MPMNNLEEDITFASDGLQLQGLLHRSGKKGIVITHPHPLYGGDMANSVVAVITHTYQDLGFTTLRFNFRGVGNSQGVYDEGRGEKLDTCNAIAYLQQIGINEVHLAGYSFGAWVNAQISKPDADFKNMVMVSPPLAFIDFGTVGHLSELKLVITGSRDEIAPDQMIKSKLLSWNPDAQLEIIRGADHFYFGFMDELKSVLTSKIEVTGKF